MTTATTATTVSLVDGRDRTAPVAGLGDVDGNLVAQIAGQARRHPTRTALVVPTEWDEHRVHSVESATFADVAQRAAAWQQHLVAAGIVPGHRVLLLLRASVDLYAAAIATIASGAVVVLVDRGMSLGRIRAAVDRAETDAVLVGPETRKFVRVLPELRRIPRVIDAAPATADVAAAPSAPAIVDRAADDGAIVSFTSGSTGRPKGADRTHGTLRAQHSSLARAFPFAPGDVDMTAWPVVVLHDLLSGVPSVVPPVRRGDLAGVPAEATLGFAIDQGVTLLNGPPAFLQPLVERAARRSARPALRRIVTGGGPVLPSLCRSVRSTFPRADGIVLYGGTEAEPVAHAPMTELIAADDDGTWSAGAGLLVGPTVPDIDVRLLPIGDTNRDTNGDIDGDVGREANGEAVQRVGPGEWGEIAVRGEHVLSRWFRDPATERTTMIPTPEGVYLRTGDIGRFDTDSRLWLGGRVADVVAVGATTWHPYEIEPVLDALPGVRRTALLADPDGRPEVFVDGPDDEHPGRDVVADVRAALNRLGHPEVSVHGPVSIPVDGRHNSKVDRPGLRARRSRLIARSRLKSIRRDLRHPFRQDVPDNSPDNIRLSQSAPMTDPLLVLDGVTKTHRRGTEEVHALIEVSLEIDAGDFVVVTGPSGSGKSTLLHAAAGLEPIDAGRILVGGEDLTKMSERAKAAWRCQGLGYVFQFFHLVGNLSAVENVAIPLLLAGDKRAEAEGKARLALDEVGLGERLDHTPAQLSGGQMQRVAVARALVTGAPLLFADEPTGNLDSASGAEVLELLRRANRERGCAVVLVTHDAAVQQDGDRSVVLQDGRRQTQTAAV